MFSIISGFQADLGNNFQFFFIISYNFGSVITGEIQGDTTILAIGKLLEIMKNYSELSWKAQPEIGNYGKIMRNHLIGVSFSLRMLSAIAFSVAALNDSYVA